MIRFRRLTLALLDAWLVDQHIPHPHQRYRLRLWRENRGALAAIELEMDGYIEEAFDDARRTLRRGFEDNLSPFNDPDVDPAANYPALLHRTTLLGYFGEILAGIAVEHWGANGQTDWVVPAFLFRLHNQEFQHLEQINERLRAGQRHDPDAREEIRLGRTGDDGLAFRMNEEHIITDIMTLEAKCLSENSNTKIEQAHAKLVEAGRRPTGVRELINLLSEYDTPEAQIWQEALLRLWYSGYETAARRDGIAYACGRIPQLAGRIAWMPADAPHPAYTLDRDLEGLEFQFGDLDTVITTLFREE